jgi:hypothetical protein
MAIPLGGGVMLDLVFVALTLAFFAAALAYVRGCERLGRSAGDAPERQP